MEAATDTTNAPEAASTHQDARAQEPYRQEAGTILLAATPIGDVRDASPRVVAALEGVLISSRICPTEKSMVWVIA